MKLYILSDIHLEREGFMDGVDLGLHGHTHSSLDYGGINETQVGILAL